MTGVPRAIIWSPALIIFEGKVQKIESLPLSKAMFQGQTLLRTGRKIWENFGRHDKVMPSPYCSIQYTDTFSWGAVLVGWGWWWRLLVQSETETLVDHEIIGPLSCCCIDWYAKKIEPLLTYKEDPSFQGVDPSLCVHSFMVEIVWGSLMLWRWLKINERAYLKGIWGVSPWFSGKVWESFYERGHKQRYADYDNILKFVNDVN